MSIGAETIRNVAVIAGGGAGKTTMTESILFNAHAIDRQGTIEDGNTVTDFEPEEIKQEKLPYHQHRHFVTGRETG